MAIGLDKIVTRTNSVISTSDFSSINSASLAGAAIALETVYSVPTIANLPPAADNKGRFIFVVNINAYRYSDGSQWTNDYRIVENQLWSWGNGDVGRLGAGTTVNICSPVQEISSSIDWCQVSAGSGHTAALKTSGQLWSWGFGCCGRLGDGATTNRCSPVREISSSTDWCQVSAGGSHTAAIKTSGQLWAWGCGSFGKLGDGTVADKCSPVREISSATDWCQVSAGDFHTAAVKTAGQLWSWGNGRCGALGDGTTVNKCSPVREISSSTDWCQVAVSNITTAIKTTGQLWSWGEGFEGILGDGTTVSKCSPVRERSSSTDWCQAGAGDTCFVVSAIKSSGQIWSWGDNFLGRLGDGTTVSKCSPVRERSSSTDWCQVSAGGAHTAAIKTSGQLWAWGVGTYGRLGDGAAVNRCSPVREITSSTNWCQVSAGGAHTAALKTSGQLWAWGGSSNYGQLGDGTTVNKCSPVREITSSTDWCQVSAGGYVSAALKTTGQLWAWGWGNCGQLGDGTTVIRCSPVREVSSSTDWCQVSASGSSGYASAAIKTSGQLWSWGQGNIGQLGDGTTTSKCSPVREISSSTDWCQVSRGSCHTAAVKTSGQLWSWGDGGVGMLGDGTTVFKCSPVREISSSANWSQVSAGRHSTTAIKLICI